MSKDKIVWVEVAQATDLLEAEVIAGLLRTEEIPSYIEQSGGLSASAFGGMGLPARVYVPEEFYDTALDLLDEDDDSPPALDEPGIKFK